MGRLHIAPAVGAGPSCCHTDVIDKVALSFRISLIAHRPLILVSAATLTNNCSTTAGIENFPPNRSHRDFPAGIGSVPAQPTETTMTLNPATHPHATDCFVI